MNWQTIELPLELKNFEIVDVQVQSQALAKNPLGDSPRRHNYALQPRSSGPWPLICHLSGYFSTGFHSFQSRTLHPNFVEQLDQATSQGEIPQAFHLFVDASTYWGGSQFINSPGCGQYTDYILNELVPAVLKKASVTSPYLVMGGSSGGYGALHLISQKGSPFDQAYAVAPDSHFEASLLPEIYKMAPTLLSFSSSLNQVKEALELGELQKKKSFFPLVHGIAMGLCYSPPQAIHKDHIDWPVDLNTGRLKEEIWQQWCQHDPIHFLPERVGVLKDKTIHLEVGRYDNFSLQFGSRQIAKWLKSEKLDFHFQEFNGNHFELRERRLAFLKNFPWS